MSRTLSPGPNSAAWLEGFEEDARRIVDLIRARLAPDPDDERADDERAAAETSCSIGKPLTVNDLQDATALVAQALGVTGALRPTEIRVRCGLVASHRPDSVDDHDFLNSFLLRDLKTVANHLKRGNAGAGLRTYLSSSVETDKRTDVRRDLGTVFAQLAPDLFPRGRWPSVGHHPLVYSQQLAVNTALAQLGEAGLFAVNGPPGTGKTTLLRDVVSSVVAQRAIELAQLKAPEDAFTGRRHWKVAKYTRSVATWRPELQGFEIVVASTNNGAVENVTREIPGLQAVDAAWAQRADYFAAYGSRLLGEGAWAMIAARLGNKAFRSEFVSRFWYGEQQGTPPDQASPTAEDGFRRLLESLEGETVDWTQAVDRFKAALGREKALRKVRQRTHTLFATVQALELRLAAAPRTEQERADRVAVLRRKQAEAQSAFGQSQTQLQVATARREDHLRLRPNWAEDLFSLGKSSREWREREAVLAQAIAACESRKQTAQNAVSGLGEAEAEAHQSWRLLQEQRRQWSGELQIAVVTMEEARAQFGSTPDPQQWRLREDERERSSPWADPDWNEARAEVFVEALHLHRAFLTANARVMRRNLHAAVDILTGNVPSDAPPEAVKAAWTSLFFVVPVVSTTFASFDRLFSHLGAEDLGYLLIDEAGQAVPQAAVGAIWRAKRTLVVGDPLQLEPIVTLPFTAQQALRRHYKVGEQWLPSRTSAQLLADRVNLYGTYVSASEGPLWVGSPLRVHRRCDQPMFDISNAVAYDGLMVFGTAARADLSYMGSGWIDVASTGADGHFIPAEAQVARQLVHSLIDQGLDAAQIFVVSPFRAVVRELGSLLPGVRVGTVHTTQGKESDAVILVLGGNPARPGAKQWASERPNLLNVAVSRAKRRLYVIGDRESWKTYPYFSVLAQQLPVIQL